MSIHDDTLQGLQEALEYVKGDTTTARTMTATTPDNDISVKYNQLPQEQQQAVRIIIDTMLKASIQ